MTQWFLQDRLSQVLSALNMYLTAYFLTCYKLKDSQRRRKEKANETGCWGIQKLDNSCSSNVHRDWLWCHLRITWLHGVGYSDLIREEKKSFIYYSHVFPCVMTDHSIMSTYRPMLVRVVNTGNFSALNHRLRPVRTMQRVAHIA